MSEKGKPLLKITNISKHYKNKLVLENINFEVNYEEILGILGVSGCGKSTLLKILCGYIKPNTGKITYDKVTTSKLSFLQEMSHIRSLIGFSSQDPSFYPNLTVYENLIYFGTLLNLQKIKLYKKIDEVLEILDLSNVKPVLASELSEGMKKRLDIACSILHEPKILILDEPTANLDFKLREELLKYIKKLNHTEKITIIFVSHYIEEIEQLADRVAILSKTNLEIVKNHKIKQIFTNHLK